MSGHVEVACEEMRLLVQADLDGELDAAATAALEAHVRDCPGCAALQRDLTALSARMRGELRPMAAPESLRRALLAHIPAEVPGPSGFRRRLGPVIGFGTGAAVAAALLLAVLPPRVGMDADAELVSGHIRALQPGHMTDVVSTDQHTVKPWFDGRVNYAPPVRDFVAEGFPLIGGRLDYVGGRAVAVLVYRRDKHPIDLYVWPTTETSGESVAAENGYSVVKWARDGMAFRAVSDVELEQLKAFASLWAK